MTREEAIKIIDCYDIGFYDLSGEKIPADKLAVAFDMAIEALSAPQTDLISRADVLKYPIRLDHYDEVNGNRHFVYGIESVMEYVESLPSADAVHGEWIWRTDIPIGDGRTSAGYVCSNCGKDYWHGNVFNYCPSCGARMYKGGGAE